MDKIIIEGAKENNLKNVSLELPKNKLIVMTGVSGSGKSSLAFDTIYKEGERRFVESLSAYARQFIGNFQKPKVDKIEGLSPSISIDQKSTSHNPRSTVGTVTEIYDYLRLIFARIGKPYCKEHKTLIKAYTIDELVNIVLNQELNSKIEIAGRAKYKEKYNLKKIAEEYLKQGYIRGEVNGDIITFDEDIEDKNLNEQFYVITDRFILKEDIRSRVHEAIDNAIKIGNDVVRIKINDDVKFYTTKYKCLVCGFTIKELEPSLFSFNSPKGACSGCNGLGKIKTISRDLILDENLSINDGCIIPYRNQEDKNIYKVKLEETCRYYNIDLNKPFKELSKKEQNIILFGSNDEIEFKITSTTGNYREQKEKYEGVITNFERRYHETNSEWIRDWIRGYMQEGECSFCDGKRLNEEALSVYINNKNISDVCKMNIKKAREFFINLKLNEEEKEIAKLGIKEIIDRLTFLEDVGLDYLTLERSAETLSGGEAQRIRLATQIGSKLTGILYVLDEPSIGLHQRDNDRLIKTLKNMRDIGNTLIVVEHDTDTMLASDYLVDVGPGAGDFGGTIVAKGTPEEVKNNKNSLTGNYLAGIKKIEVPKKRKKINKNEVIKIIGASENNLKNINVDIPLHVLTVVTGVSGSGKSSLINEVLVKNIEQHLSKSKRIIPGKVKEIKNINKIEKLIEISQSPIGRTPRSNPATYTKVFDDIRDLFANTNAAKEKGYNKGKFSFNVKGGRCEACQGDGVKKVSMHFLPDVYVKCEVCKGTRYQKETLDVKFKGKSIYDVLEMRISTAKEFFKEIYKIRVKLEALEKVGLGYLKLGENSTNLSGGEAQRVKLASELSSNIKENTLYVLDEPTTGLHQDDVSKLIKVIEEIKECNSTIIIIEHNLDIIKQADYIIDLGPEGGDNGGMIVARGTPEEISEVKKSYTGYYLKKVLGE